jgi:hypothetical protein
MMPDLRPQKDLALGRRRRTQTRLR